MLILFLYTEGFAYNHSDLNPHAWYYNEVMPWVKRGIYTGYRESGLLTLDPNGEITRAEMCMYINRVFGFSTFDGAFKDVKKSDWFYKDVSIAKKNYIPFYEDALFKGKEKIQRQEAIAMLSVALGLLPEDIFVYSDSFQDGKQVKESLKPYMEAAIRQKLIYGYSFNGKYYLRPEKTITRAEVMALFSRSFGKIYNEAGFYDYAKTLIIDEDVAIATGNVNLKNIHIKGHLFLLPGIKNQGVSLENVTVDKNIYIQGGRWDLVKFRSVKADKVVCSSYNGGVSISAKSRMGQIYMRNRGTVAQVSMASSGAKKLTVDTTRAVTLRGKFSDVVIEKPAPVVIDGYEEIDNLTVSETGEGADIRILSQAQVHKVFLKTKARLHAEGVVKLLYSQVGGTISGRFYGVKQEKTGSLSLVGKNDIRILEVGEEATASRIEANPLTQITTFIAKSSVDVTGDPKIRYRRIFSSGVYIDGTGYNRIEEEKKAPKETKQTEMLQIRLSKGQGILYDGIKNQLEATSKEDDRFLKTAKWKIENQKGDVRAEIDETTGEITAFGQGSITVSVENTKDPTQRGQAGFSVARQNEGAKKGAYIQPKSGNGFMASGEEMALMILDEKGQTHAIWSISEKDSGILNATIDMTGKLYAEGKGSLTIKAVSVSGQEAFYTATVGDYQESDKQKYSVITQFGNDYVRSGQPTQLYLKKEKDLVNATWTLKESNPALSVVLTGSGLLNGVGSGEIEVVAETKEGLRHTQRLKIIP